MKAKGGKKEVQCSATGGLSLGRGLKSRGPLVGRRSGLGKARIIMWGRRHTKSSQRCGLEVSNIKIRETDSGNRLTKGGGAWEVNVGHLFTS